MVSILFTLLMIMVFGKIFFFALKTTWGITKIILTIVVLPIVLIAFVFAGLMSIALPLLLIIGVLSFAFCAD